MQCVLARFLEAASGVSWFVSQCRGGHYDGGTQDCKKISTYLGRKLCWRDVMMGDGGSRKDQQSDFEPDTYLPKQLGDKIKKRAPVGHRNSFTLPRDEPRAPLEVSDESRYTSWC